MPDEIGQLASLVEFDLRNSQLTELPGSISGLKNLKILLKKTIIPEPGWVTGTVYKVLDSREVMERRGISDR